MLPALDIDSHGDSEKKGWARGSDADVAALVLCWSEHGRLLGAM